MPSHPRNIWIENDLWESAAEWSQTTGMSRGKIVNLALSQFLTSLGPEATFTASATFDASGPTHRQPPAKVPQTADDDVEF